MKYCSILFLALFVFACNKSIKYPNWYMLPPENNNKFLYGAGEGFDVEDAKYVALSSIASKLKVSVSSSSSSRMEEDSLGYSSSSSFKVKSNVEKISFNNYSMVKNEKLSNGNNIVLVKVDVKKFIFGLKNEISSMENKISNYLKTSKSDKFKRYVNLRTGMEKLNAINNKLDLIFLVSNEKFSGNSQLYHILVNEYNKSVQSLSFKVVANNGKLKDIIEKMLSDEKILLNTKNSIIIDADVNFDDNKIQGAYFSKARISLSTIERNGGKSVTKILNTTGSSVINKKMAQDNAVSTIEKQANDGLINFLSS